MYGYFALKKGTEWTFTVEDTAGQYADDVKKALTGKKRIGRSRSAEYGLVEISFIKEQTVNSKPVSSTALAYIYAESNLCFYNEYGRNTATPTAKDLKLPEGSTINWQKTQLRTRLYQTWNRHRNNRDADRVIIEKGSVFAVHLSEDIDSSLFKNGVGAHRSEGFGKVQINPTFLQSDTAVLNFPLQKAKLEDWKAQNEYFARTAGTQDTLVLSYLKKRKAAAEKVFDIDKQVNDCIRENPSLKSIKPSQWGIVRNYAKYAADVKALNKLLFDTSVGCCYRGQSEKDWRKQGRRDKLQKFINRLPEAYIIPFTIKLAAQMAKQKSKSHA